MVDLPVWIALWFVAMPVSGDGGGEYVIRAYGGIGG